MYFQVLQAEIRDSEGVSYLGLGLLGHHRGGRGHGDAHNIVRDHRDCGNQAERQSRGRVRHGGWLRMGACGY